MSNTNEKLIRMANQIASFFATQPGDTGAASTAQHIRDFWDPSMIAQLGELLISGTTGLDPMAQTAAQDVTGVHPS